MNGISRFWVAALFAPLSVPICLGIGQLLVGPEEFIWTGLWIAAAFSYLGFIVLGLPCLLILRSYGRLSFVAILIASIVAGALYGIFLETFIGGPGVRVSFAVLRLPVFFSVIVATTFSVFAKVRLS